ncbi:MAG TPA: methylmalonyl-CoA mutase family protein [Candidatus Cloacimonadota bacterium]|nr:methylmalonyl-CoA mutase family protein [Candidatus Cloacimonadota bacterium]
MSNSTDQPRLKPHRLSDDFPIPSYEEWRKVVEASLKGVPFEKAMITPTYEGILLQPIYRAEDANFIDSLPGESPYRRGTDPLGYLEKGWKIVEANNEEGNREQGTENRAEELRIKNEDLRIAERDIVIDTEEFHNKGASAVEELAIATSIAVQAIEEGNRQQVTGNRAEQINEILQRVRFEFCIGSNFFMEIAKLRAARILWATVAQAFGGNEDSQKITLHAKTSRYNKTIFDPYVNILRTTTEAFSAVLGGTDSLQIDPFDTVIRETDDFSKRIARNQHYILKEEAHMDALVDPAGGSWYVESLTSQLAEKAWAFFQEIEAKGGFSQAQDMINEKIAAIAALREKNLRTRKDVMVGTNMFANPGEEVLGDLNSIRLESYATLAYPYENMRLAVERHIAKTGKRPSVFLATMGPLNQHKARADFSQGFFTPGGFKVIDPGIGFQGPEVPSTCVEAYIESGAEAVCICSTDDTYPEIVPNLVSLIRQKTPNTCVILAGYPTDMVETYKLQGVNEFIHIRADVVDTLTRVLKAVGVAI